MAPTKIYVKALKHIKASGITLKACSHITGGGFYENVPRMLKEGMGVEIDTKAFPKPPIFDLIQKNGDISTKEMYNVFNMGLGFVMAVDPSDVEKVQAALNEIKEPSSICDKIVSKLVPEPLANTAIFTIGHLPVLFQLLYQPHS